MTELQECIPDNKQSYDIHIESSLADIIGEFLDSLDKKSRVMFVKRYWYIESISSIADEFGMTENYVSVKLLRIRVKMKAYLEKKGVVL